MAAKQPISPAFFNALTENCLVLDVDFNKEGLYYTMIMSWNE